MKGAKKFWLAALMVAALAWSAQATNVTFQLNMSVQEELGNFDPEADIVVARGSFNGWAGNANELTLTGDYYTMTVDIAPGDIEYKYVIPDLENPDNDNWEDVGNRTLTVGAEPITIDPVYFDNITSAVSADVEVNFRVDMNVQIATNVFNPDVDWVVVRGGHANLGNWGGAVRLLEETGNPGIYSLRITFDNLPVPNVEMQYKFVRLPGGDPNQAAWENVADPDHGNNRYFLPTGTEPDLFPPPSGNGYGEIDPALVFFSNITADDIITSDVDVVFRVEVTPLLGCLDAEDCYPIDVQTGDTVSVLENIVVTGMLSIWNWGNIAPERFMNDEGLNGDETAGDDIYSLTFHFASGSPRVIEYKYGANQYDVEGGVGDNHLRPIDDSGETYVLDIDCFGSVGDFYADWPCLVSGAETPDVTQPADYSLAQNFPNPFNPSTSISFSLPVADHVKLFVFDLLGREVSTMNLGNMQAGKHTVGFDGAALASGVYFYRLETPNFDATRKMLLLK